MFIITKKPVTPSQRQLVQLNRKKITKNPLLTTFIKGTVNSNGRNSSGKITVRRKGGGHKKNYRTINFFRTTNSTAIVCSIEYDPNRTSNIAATFDVFNQKFSYILAPKNLKIGDIVKSGLNAETKNGHSLPISKIPVGSYIYNISSKPNRPAQISRAAGTFSQLTEKTLNYAKIKLSSGQQYSISVKCFAAIGITSNEFSFLIKLGKAGQSRWLNKRPKVRGVAMNPVDHPHGGGEGKKSGLGQTPWGKPTRGRKTGKMNKNKLTIKN